MFMPVHIHTCACTRACIPVCVLVSCANTCTWMPVRVCLYVHAPWLDPDRRRKRPLRPRAPAGCGWEKPWLTVGAHSLYIAEYRTHAAISMSFLLPGQGEGRESSPPKNTTGNASHCAPPGPPHLVWSPAAVALPCPSLFLLPAAGAGAFSPLVHSGETGPGPGVLQWAHWLLVEQFLLLAAPYPGLGVTCLCPARTWLCSDLLPTSCLRLSSLS